MTLSWFYFMRIRFVVMEEHHKEDILETCVVNGLAALEQGSGYEHGSKQRF